MPRLSCSPSTVWTLAGTGVPGTEDGLFTRAQFNCPSGLAFDRGITFASTTAVPRTGAGSESNTNGAGAGAGDAGNAHAPSLGALGEKATPHPVNVVGALAEETPPGLTALHALAAMWAACGCTWPMGRQAASARRFGCR